MWNSWFGGVSWLKGWKSVLKWGHLSRTCHSCAMFTFWFGKFDHFSAVLRAWNSGNRQSIEGEGYLFMVSVYWMCLLWRIQYQEWVIGVIPWHPLPPPPPKRKKKTGMFTFCMDGLGSFFVSFGGWITVISEAEMSILFYSNAFSSIL